MNRIARYLEITFLLMLGLGVPGGWAQQPVAAEPQAPSRTVQTPSELVPALPVPRLVKFAGTLRDELGKPRTGVVGVTFSVYKEQEGGAALWLETQNVELDEQGRYTVLLGSSKSEGLPLELFIAGEPRWLGVQVNLPKEMEQPRVLLVSVPYALKASDADTLGGKPASVYLTTEQGGGIGTTGKANGGAGIISSAVSGTGSTNVVAKWLDSVGTLGNSQISDDGTNVNMTGNVGALAYKFTGNAAPPTDATATILNQANVGPVFSGLSFKVRTGVPVPGDALSIDTSQNVSMTGNASALAYKFTGNATPPTDATATILNQANVGPVFSVLSFKVRTGAPVPADALSIDPSQNVSVVKGNLMLSGAGNAIVFPDGTVQSTAVKGTGGGTITGVAAGAGLTGGGTTGGVTLGIANGGVTNALIAGNSVSNANIADGSLSPAKITGIAATLGPNSFTGSQSISGNVSLTGTLALPNTTSATAGVISLGGTPFLHNFGISNTFVGASAGNTSASLTGTNNTGVGSSALLANTTGSFNSAFGDSALFSHRTGNFNAAFGAQALFSDTTGFNNAAFGTFALFANTTGNSNSAFGASALNANTTGVNNSAFGSSALKSNNPTMAGEGQDNSALGANALFANTTGSDNAAFGFGALSSNTTANGNSAFGTSALNANTTGHSNSAFGAFALNANTTGFDNAAFGAQALFSDTMGFNNAAFGPFALLRNTTGAANSAFGSQALQLNTTGFDNAAFGAFALFANTTGTSNAAFGESALTNLLSGNSNVAIGVGAGSSLSSAESNDIYINNTGIGGESNTIRIGAPAVQTATFIAGISGATSASGVAVLVNSSGQLGTTTSSRRFKHDIADMGRESDLLMKLRPVAFYYKPELDETRTRQYGLVAEEVAQVAPQLVVFDKDGAPQTVRYHFVNAMLLNELQKQHRQIEAQERQIQTQQEQLQAQGAAIVALETQLEGLKVRLDGSATSSQK